MNKQTLGWINLGLAGLVILLLLLTAGYHFTRPSSIPIPELKPEKSQLPLSAFHMKQEVYDDIGPPLVELRFSPTALQLPDLRTVINYFGRNDRPDADPSKSVLHFSIAGGTDVVSVEPGKPLYLIYDKDQTRTKYRFSPNNAPTSLWVEVTPGEKEATVHVSMKNEAGEIVRKPEQFSKFSSAEKPSNRFGTAGRWDIGEWKADGTLLARQKARWYGQDLFLQRHGGKEYQQNEGKERIDFLEGNYSVFVGPGDSLAWKENKWVQMTPGDESRKYPLLVVGKVEDKLMRLDVWDVGGKSKIPLNLIKTSEPAPSDTLLKMFKFVGARTRTQLTFEIQGKRELVSPKDWFLYYDGQWKKLVTPEDIDAYVDRKTPGPLFVVDTVTDVEGKQVMQGTLFNSARSEVKSIEIALQQAPTKALTPPEKIKELPQEHDIRGQEVPSTETSMRPQLEGQMRKQGDAQISQEQRRLEAIERFKEKFRGSMPSQVGGDSLRVPPKEGMRK